MKLLVLIVLVLAGCAHDPDPPASICRNRNLEWGRWAWEQEAAKRFERPVVFMCHGATKDGRWMCYPDDGPAMPVEGVARLLHSAFPKRPIVLVVCNESGEVIHVPDVYYAKRKVLASPLPFMRDDATGSVWTFVN